MKQIYIVMSNDYHEKPLMAFQNRNDAMKAASALYDADIDESLNKRIKSLPFTCDMPEKVDFADVQTLIDMTIKACDTSMRSEGGRMSDNVNQPSHYQGDGMECFDALRGMLGKKGFSDFCRGNVLKYVWRADKKNGREDLLKARRYLDILIGGAEDD